MDIESVGLTTQYELQRIIDEQIDESMIQKIVNHQINVEASVAQTAKQKKILSVLRETARAEKKWDDNKLSVDVYFIGLPEEDESYADLVRDNSLTTLDPYLENIIYDVVDSPESQERLYNCITE